jgi:hexosaminidase
MERRMLPLVPQPAVLRARAGSFALVPGTPFVLDPGAHGEAPVLGGALRGLLGFEPDFVEPAARPSAGPAVRLRLGADGSLGREGYRLRVTPGAVTVDAAGPAGLAWGCRTLGQLADHPGGRCARFPCLEIEDSPRFPWRGLMLDVCRHFFPIDVVKRCIDLLAMHKMNVFHWHLTDDEGWRIEIDRFPRLAEVGAWRSGTVVGYQLVAPRRYDRTRHGGWYSKREIREVVSYAAQRHVTVVPEIEMPGHATAALAAYPELSCTGGPFQVSRQWGVHREVFCAGNDAVFEFVEGVLDEVVPLFPSVFLHIGGDECPRGRWRACPKCQERIRREGLADENALQSWFVRKLEGMLDRRGRRLVGWDEILEGGLAPKATVMSWRGTSGGVAAARQGHDAIMCPTSHCYLDYGQSPRRLAEPLAQPLVTTLRKAYSFEPVPPELPAAAARHVLGLQGNLWTEYVPTPEHAEYMTWPRACALAEVAWSPLAGRSWDDFSRRLPAHLRRLDLLGVNYRPLRRPAARDRLRRSR